MRFSLAPNIKSLYAIIVALLMAFALFVCPLTARAEAITESGLTVDVGIKNTAAHEYQPEVEAASGGSIEVRAVITNTGNETRQIVAFVSLPGALSFCSGTAEVLNGSDNDVTLLDTDKILSLEGLKIGEYAPGEQATITFYANLDDSQMTAGRHSIPMNVSARTADYANGTGELLWTSGFVNSNATVNVTMPVPAEIQAGMDGIEKSNEDIANRIS
jgi:hypothetical protein